MRPSLERINTETGQGGRVQRWEEREENPLPRAGEEGRSPPPPTPQSWRQHCWLLAPISLKPDYLAHCVSCVFILHPPLLTSEAICQATSNSTETALPASLSIYLTEIINKKEKPHAQRCPLQSYVQEGQTGSLQRSSN